MDQSNVTKWKSTGLIDSLSPHTYLEISKYLDDALLVIESFEAFHVNDMFFIHQGLLPLIVMIYKQKVTNISIPKILKLISNNVYHEYRESHDYLFLTEFENETAYLEFICKLYIKENG
jgi:hypothetical protein